MAGVERRTPTDEVLKKLGMVPLSEKRRIHQSVFLHKLVNGRGPTELCARLEETRRNKENIDHEIEGLRSKRTLQIRPQQHRTAKFEKSTMWRAAKAWNLTKTEHRFLDDTSKFKVEVQRGVWRAYHGC